MLRDGYRCRLCGARRRARELEVDHILEIAAGGAALEYSNLQTVCRSCHRAKTTAFRRGRQRPVPVPPSSDRSSVGIENPSPVPVP